MEKEEEKEEVCCTCNNPAQEPHPCPFLEEIGGDSKTLCNCCKDCQNECRRDI